MSSSSQIPPGKVDSPLLLQVLHDPCTNDGVDFGYSKEGCMFFLFFFLFFVN